MGAEVVGEVGVGGKVGEDEVEEGGGAGGDAEGRVVFQLFAVAAFEGAGEVQVRVGRCGRVGSGEEAVAAVDGDEEVFGGDDFVLAAHSGFEWEVEEWRYAWAGTLEWSVHLAWAARLA